MGARTPAAASRRLPPPPDSGKLRGVPRVGWDEKDTLQIKSNPTPHPNPNCGGYGRRSAAAAGPCPLAGDQQVNCWGGERGGGPAAGPRAAGWRGPRRPLAGRPPRRSEPAVLTPAFPSPWRGSKGLSRPRATVSTAPSSRGDRQQRASAPARSRRGDRSRRCATGARRASRRHQPLPRRPHPCLPHPLQASHRAPARSAPGWRGLRGAWQPRRIPAEEEGRGRAAPQSLWTGGPPSPWAST